MSAECSTLHGREEDSRETGKGGQEALLRLVLHQVKSAECSTLSFAIYILDLGWKFTSPVLGRRVPGPPRPGAQTPTCLSQPGSAQHPESTTSTGVLSSPAWRRHSNPASTVREMYKTFKGACTSRPLKWESLGLRPVSGVYPWTGDRAQRGGPRLYEAAPGRTAGSTVKPRLDRFPI